MYCNFFGLRTNPFSPTPDPEFLFLSLGHKQALGSIIYGVTEKKGFISVTGQVGLGKTTILRSYLDQLDEAHQHAIYLLNPNMLFSSLLKTLLQELGHEPIKGDEAAVVEQLHMVLIQEYQKGQTVVLLIDEAQNMPASTLEQLRMLSNLETPKDKLIQIVMLGQPEFDSLLDRYELRQIRQRIALRATIRPLSHEESFQYIRHRLDKAGGEGKTIFTNSALKRIVREAEGIPRRLNILCDNALVTALGYKKNPVTAGIAKEVINDLSGKRSHTLWKLIPLAAGALTLVLGLVALMPLTDFKISDTPPLQEVAHVFEQGNNQNQELLNGAKTAHVSVQEDFSPLESIPTLQVELESILVDPIDMFPIQPTSENLNPSTEPPVRHENEAPENQLTPEIFPQVMQANDITASTDIENFNLSTAQTAKNVIEEREHQPKPESIPQVTPGNNMATAMSSGNLKPSPVQMTKSVSEELEGLSESERIPQVMPVDNPAASPEFSSKKQNAVTSQLPVTKIMRKGNTLAGLMKEVYGSASPATIRFVLSHNRHIVNVRKIFPGQQILFPPLIKKNVEQGLVNTVSVMVSHTGEELRSSKKIFTESSARSKSNQKKNKAKRKQPYAVATVQEGDTLEKLAKVVYGSSDPRYVQGVLDFNPKILNPRKIFPGQEIVFPKLSEEETVLTSQSSQSHSP